MRSKIGIALTLGILLLLPGQALAGQAEMWDFADRVSQELNPYFNQEQGLYMTPADQVHLSSSMLAVHARAAIAEHQGAARQDRLIEPLARRMINWPIYIEDYNQGSGNHRHAPGFTIGVSSPREQHVSFDMQIGNALALAVKSGKLTPGTEALIRQRVPLVAQQPTFSYPEVKLNQVNWPIQLWAASGYLSGDWARAGQEVRGQMKQWIDGMFKPMPGMPLPNLSRGMGLHYAVNRQASSANQVSTTEYANIIYAGFNVYQDMLDQGMKPLSQEDEAKMQAWAGRLLRGDWTHGGWPNWDTGHGFERWHLMRYWPWAAEGLSAIATGGRLADPQDQAYASWLLEQVFKRYDWLKSRGKIGATRYGLPTQFGKASDGPITAARLAAIASRVAISDQLAQPVRPPGYWWYDPEMKRLAVSSPKYSAALMLPISKPNYGGLELSRLLDSQGRVLTSLGANRAQSGVILKSGESSQAESGRERSSYRIDRVRGSKTLGQVSIWGSTRSGKIRVKNTFRLGKIDSSYRISGPGAEIRLPLWGKVKIRGVKRSGKTMNLSTVNSEQGKLSITVRSSQRLAAKVVSIGRQPASPQSRKQIRFLLKQPGRISITLIPKS